MKRFGIHPNAYYNYLKETKKAFNAQKAEICAQIRELYHETNGTVRYNCSIIDLYDRSIVASKNGRFITSDLAIETVRKALRATGFNPAKLTLHSNQGSQFTSKEFIDFCEGLGIQQSMSKAGCPYDNAPMERYYNT